MARQPRFLLPGEAHLVQQAGHNGAAIVHDDEDRCQWLALLRDTVATHRIALHGWAVDDAQFRLLLTPPDARALSRLMQTLGRRYVGWFNARHGRTGTLWDGRFRACPVEPGPWVLTALRYVEQPPVAGVATIGSGGAVALASSLAHHLGQSTDPAVSDAPAYWALGNTPFEREAAYRALIDAGLPERERHAVEASLRGGRPLGGRAYVAALEQAARRPLTPRPRGRPAKT